MADISIKDAPLINNVSGTEKIPISNGSDKPAAITVNQILDKVDLSSFALKSELPTKVSQLENDANYTTIETLNQTVQVVNSTLQSVSEAANKADDTATDALTLAEGIQGSLSSFALKENVNALESQMVTGDIKYIKKVTALPDSPDPNTFYIITA